LAKQHSYTITIENNKSEKEAIDYLISMNSNFILPDKRSRKMLLDIFGIDQKYIRAFDLIYISGHSNIEDIIEFKSKDEVTFIELKTTKKKLTNLPKGFFFGATQREFEIAERLGEQYKFCFVSLHEESLGFELLTLKELNGIIRTKRIQYQINL
jgi:hypothetical protein